MKDKLLFNIFQNLGLLWEDLLIFDSSGEPHFESIKKNGWQEFLDQWEKYFLKIRFINPENIFDYSKFGDYFFSEGELFIATDRPGYEALDLKINNKHPELLQLVNHKRFLIKAGFAGFYIGKKDDLGEKIYYGDILKLDIDNYSKCMGCHFFNGLDQRTRESMNERGLLKNIYGPITFHKGWYHCKNQLEQFSIMDQWFGIIPNLCMAVKKEVVANVYYDFSINSPKKFDLGLISKAELTDHTISCQFWDKYVPQSYIENNSRNDIWEYAINEYRNERELSRK